jgi:hypothetical protein
MGCCRDERPADAGSVAVADGIALTNSLHRSLQAPGPSRMARYPEAMTKGPDASAPEISRFHGWECWSGAIVRIPILSTRSTDGNAEMYKGQELFNPKS